MVPYSAGQTTLAQGLGVSGRVITYSLPSAVKNPYLVWKSLATLSLSPKPESNFAGGSNVRRPGRIASMPAGGTREHVRGAGAAAGPPRLELLIGLPARPCDS